MKMEIDFTNAGEVFDTLAEGTYEAKCYNFEIKDSPTSGNKVGWFHLVTSRGSIVMMNAINAGDNNRYLKQTLACLGYNSNDLAQNAVIDFDLILDKLCVITVEQEAAVSKAGKPITRAKISKIWNMEEAASMLPKDGIIRFSGGGSTSNHSQAKTSSKASTPPPNIPLDDDIPF